MLQFNRLGGDCNIFHFVTTRHGGTGIGEYTSFNLGEFCGDNPKVVSENRKRLCSIAGIPEENLLVPYQTHGDVVRIIDLETMALPKAEREDILHGVDALVTNLPDICIAVTTADCVPILLYAPDKKVIAAVHAGWRGTVQRIVEKTVALMVDNYGASPSTILSGIAPSISQAAFEVGNEVVEEFEKAGFDISSICKQNKNSGKAHLDLQEANRLQLLNSGLKPENIEMANLCTYTDNNDFFSARRQGIKSGRILSGIMIKQ